MTTTFYRLDKRQKCIKGKLCKDICIPKKKKCREGQKTLSVRPEVGRKPQKSSFSTASALASMSGLAVIASGAGITVATANVLKNRYIQNIPKIAEKANSLSQAIDLDTLPDFTGKKGILLNMPGLSGHLGAIQQEYAERLMESKVKEDIGDEYGVYTLSNTKFNIGKNIPIYIPESFNPLDPGTYREAPKIGRSAAINLVETVANTLIKGENEQATEATAYLLAMKRKFQLQNPGVNPEIKAIGHSAGGMILSDTNMHMKALGHPDVDMLFIGSPHFGINKDSSNIVRVHSKNDRVTGRLPRGESIDIDEVTHHAKYFDNPKAKEIFKLFGKVKASEINAKYNKAQKTDSINTVSAQGRGAQLDERQKCVKGKSCGDICIPKKHKCQQNRTNKAIVKGSIVASATAGLGISLATRKALKDYKQGYKESAKKAKSSSNNADIPLVSEEVQTFVFSLGGWGASKGGENPTLEYSQELAQELESIAFGRKVKIEPVEYSGYYSPFAESPLGALKRIVKGIATEKHNPVALDMAAKAIALKKKHPHLEIRAVGHSGSGITVGEWEAIMREAGYPVKAVAIGTPSIGIFDDSKGTFKTAYSENDPLKKYTKVKGHSEVNFNNVKGHHIKDYFGDDNFKNFLSDELFAQRREDSVRLDKRQRCIKGKPCGDVCIPKKHECQEEFPHKNGDYTINPKTRQEYTIRELKQLAREKQVYRYSELDKKSLQVALKDADKPREERERVAKTFTGFKTPSQKAIDLAFQGRENKRTKATAKSASRTLKNLQALAKFADSQPIQWGSAAAGMFLAGEGIRQYGRFKSHYRAGFKESAKQAAEKALTLSPPRTPKDNITFVVGSNDKNTKIIQDKFNEIGQHSDEKEDQFFSDSKQHFIGFTLQESKFEETGNRLVDSVNIARTYIENIKRGKNQDAIEMAAQIYALGIQRDKASGKNFVNKGKKINIITDQLGGQATKEALEYLARIEVKGQPSGKSILEQVNLVSLGTPHFGFTENVSNRQKTIVSGREPLANVPVWGSEARPEWISSVKGNKVEDYLSDKRVIQSIRESFGYYEDSLIEIARKKKKRRKQKPIEGETLQ